MTGRFLVLSAVCLTLTSPAAAQEPLQGSPLAAKPVSIPETIGVTGTTGITAPEPAKPAAARTKGGLSATEARLAEAAANEYQIGPEDALDISVGKNPEPNRTVPARPAR